MMVSKESGRAGGFLEKYQAAKETGCRMMSSDDRRKNKVWNWKNVIEYLNRRFLFGRNCCK